MVGRAKRDDSNLTALPPPLRLMKVTYLDENITVAIIGLAGKKQYVPTTSNHYDQSNIPLDQST